MVRLDTNAALTEAIAMYERAGYRAIERYNDNPYAEGLVREGAAVVGLAGEEHQQVSAASWSGSSGRRVSSGAMIVLPSVGPSR